MLPWRILLATVILVIAVCMAADYELRRSETTDNIRNQVSKIRAQHSQLGGNRYGKRHIPTLYKRDARRSLQDWLAFYDLIDNYEAM